MTAPNTMRGSQSPWHLQAAGSPSDPPVLWEETQPRADTGATCRGEQLVGPTGRGLRGQRLHQGLGCGLSVALCHGHRAAGHRPPAQPLVAAHGPACATSPQHCLRLAESLEPPARAQPPGPSHDVWAPWDSGDASLWHCQPPSASLTKAPSREGPAGPQPAWTPGARRLASSALAAGPGRSRPSACPLTSQGDAGPSPDLLCGGLQDDPTSLLLSSRTPWLPDGRTPAGRGRKAGAQQPPPEEPAWDGAAFRPGRGRRSGAHLGAQAGPAWAGEARAPGEGPDPSPTHRGAS